eukprot:jgi/Galph1/4227/GphlegSOOS_G2878.1
MENKRLLHFLARVGDKVKLKGDLESQVSKAAEVLQPKLSTAYGLYTVELGESLLKCALELSHKSVTYAAIAGVISASDCSESVPFAQFLGTRIRDELERDLRNCNFQRCRAALRFCANLTQASVFNPHTFIVWMHNLLVDAGKPSQSEEGFNPEARKHQLFDLCASTLLWCGRVFSERCSSQLLELVERLRVVFNDLYQTSVGIDRLLFMEIILPTERSLVRSKTENTMKIVEFAHAKNWPRNLVLWLYDSFETTFARGLEVNLPLLTVPPHSRNQVYPFPEIDLLFLLDDNDEMTKMNEDGYSEPSLLNSEHLEPLRSYFSQVIISDSIYNLQANHSLAAAVVLSHAFSQVEPFVDEMETYVIMIRTILLRLIQLPLVKESLVYYHVLLVDLCCMEGSQAPLKLLVAVEQIFEYASSLDPEVFDRLTDWFAIHLSNFGMKWNWDDWVFVSSPQAGQQRNTAYQKLFCRDILQKCQRLSYLEYVSNSIPESLRMLILDSGQIGILNETEEETTVAMELSKYMIGKEKKPSSEIEQFLSIRFPFENSSASALRTLSRALFLSGSKTFSHFDVVIEKYLDLLRKLFAQDRSNMKRLFMLEVKNFWGSSPQHIEYILEKIWAYRLVDGSTVFDTVISPSWEDANFLDEMKETWRWKFARRIFDRAEEHCELAKEELSKAAQAASEATEGETDIANVRLKNAQAANDSALKEQKELFLHALRRIYIIYKFLKQKHDYMDSANLEDVATEEVERKVSISLCFWRVSGFLKEMIRKHIELLQSMSMMSLKATLNLETPIEAASEIFQQAKSIMEYQTGYSFGVDG